MEVCKFWEKAMVIMMLFSLNETDHGGGSSICKVPYAAVAESGSRSSEEEDHFLVSALYLVIGISRENVRELLFLGQKEIGGA